jgi:hypothetical protein
VRHHEEVWRKVLSYLGPGLHLPLAATCSTFCSSYRALHSAKATSMPLLVAAPLPLLQWALASGGCPRHHKLGAWAAAAGRVDTLQWLVASAADDADKAKVLSDDTVAAAARSGQLPVLRWAASEDAGADAVQRAACTAAAAEGGHAGQCAAARVCSSAYVKVDPTDLLSGQRRWLCMCALQPTVRKIHS